MDQEVKVKITTDASDAVAGFQKFHNEADKTDKHAASIGASIKKNWMAVSAGTAAAAVAMHQAMQYMEQAAQARSVESSFRIMAEASKINADAMIANMQRATRSTIDSSDMMQKAVKLMLQGYNADQIVRFSENAVTAAKYMGTSVSEAYETMGDAIANKMPKALVRAGAVTREQVELVNKAVAAGADEMALYELAMANLEVKTLKLKGTQDGATIAIQQFYAQIKDTKEYIGGFFIDALQGAYGVLQWLAAGVLTAAGSIPYLLAQMKYFQAWVKEKMGGGAEAVNIRKSADETMRVAQDMFNAAQDLTGKAAVNISGVAEAEQKASAASVAAAERKVKAQENYLKKLVEEKASQKDLERQARETGRIISQAMEDAISDMAHEVDKGYRETIDNLKRLAEYAKIMRGEESFTTDPHKEAINRVLEDEREKYAAIKDMQDRHLISFEQAEKDKQIIAQNSARKIAEINDDLYKQQLRDMSAGFGQLADAFAGIGAMYEKGSKDAQMWEDAAKAMEIAQRAVAVVNAVAAVAASAAAPWPAGFVSMAAMAASMVSLLGSIGLSLGGGGSSGLTAQTPAMGNSTVLGAAYGTASESLSKSFELLQETYELEDTKLTDIYNALRDLSKNIMGLVSGIIRTGGKFDGLTLESDAIAATRAREVFMGGDVIRTLHKWGGEQLGIKNLEIWADPISYMVNNLLGDLVQSVVTGIFGGEKTIGTIGAGYKIGGSSIQDIMSGGVNTQQYQTIMSKTSGGWFGDDKVAIGTIYSEVDAEVANLFNKVFQNLGGTLVGLAELLGTDISDALGYQFKDIKLNLMGKDGEGISKAISEALSAAGDTAAKALFGDLISRYQQVNEGLLETATRLVIDKESVMNILQYTNQAFDGTTSELLTFSEALIDVAGSLEDLTEAFQTYYDAFFSDAEKQADLKRQLSGALGSYGYSLPGTRAGYRALVEGVNMADDAGKAAYAALMMLADSADAYYDYIEDAKSKINESDYAIRVEYMRAVRGYASGGYHAGGYRIVGEYGPELESTGPSTIYNTSNTRKALGTDDLIASVEKLRAEVGQANFNVASTQLKLAKLLDKWDGEGIPPART